MDAQELILGKVGRRLYRLPTRILILSQSRVIPAGMPESKPGTVTRKLHKRLVQEKWQSQACHPWTLDSGIPAGMTEYTVSFVFNKTGLSKRKPNCSFRVR
jgi:hypothetical protein